MRESACELVLHSGRKKRYRLHHYVECLHFTWLQILEQSALDAQMKSRLFFPAIQHYAFFERIILLMR